MQELLDRLRTRFDVVLLDSPPALVVTDASVLATLVDGLVVVARADKTRRGALRATIEELAQSGRPIAGIILNRVQGRETGYYYYEYGRSYGDDQETEAPPAQRVTRPQRAAEADEEATVEAS
jgi:Mrp family chromosome partitioning ATPase